MKAASFSILGGALTPWGEAVELSAVGASKMTVLTFSPDGALLAGGDDAGSTRIWDVRRHELLLTVVPAPDGGWVAFDPAGRFDTSDDLASDRVVWVVGGEPYDLDTFSDDYRDPGLIRKALQARSELRVVPPLAALRGQ